MLEGRSEALTRQMAATAPIMAEFASRPAGIKMNNFRHTHYFARLKAIIFMRWDVDKSIGRASLKAVFLIANKFLKDKCLAA